MLEYVIIAFVCAGLGWVFGQWQTKQRMLNELSSMHEFIDAEVNQFSAAVRSNLHSAIENLQYRFKL